MSKVVCFTGHRSLHETEFFELGPVLVAAIKSLYRDDGCRVFISGAARGFDTYAAAAVAAQRDDLPGLEMWLAVPFSGHDRGWSAKERGYFERMRGLADNVTVLSESYDSGVYARRNRWMVDRADVCLAYYEGRSGGTAQTVAYATAQGKRVINLYDYLKK